MHAYTYIHTYVCSMQNSALLVGHGDRDTFDRMFLIYLFILS